VACYLFSVITLILGAALLVAAVAGLLLPGESPFV
jgi:hypothetical protein